MPSVSLVMKLFQCVCHDGPGNKNYQRGSKKRLINLQSICGGRIHVLIEWGGMRICIIV